MKNWKFGISAAYSAPKTAPILLTGDICDCLRKAAQLGFDAIEYHTRETAVFDYEEIRRTMAETGCRISMIVTGRLFTEGGFSLTSEDADNRKQALDGMLKYVDMAAEVGAGLVLGWAKGNIRNTSGADAYFARLTESLKVIDAYAAQKQVPVNIEVINHYEVDAFLTARELAVYLDKNQFVSCFVHLDTFHMQLEEEDYVQAIHTAGKRLGYVHFADSTRWYPGSGYMNYRDIFKALRDVDYQGYLTIECFPHEDNEDTARKGLATLKAAVDALV